MKELSFWEKLVVLFDNILDHPLFMLLFLLPIIMFFFQKKHGKKVFVIVYIIIMATIFILFGDILFKLFDNLMDGLFMFLYFPNFITLFGVVVACSLIALVSLFMNIRKINKVINFVSFGLVHTLFSLILIAVRVNKINIYKEDALYTNNDVLTLMQLLIGVFAIQVISLFVIKLIDKATLSLDKKTEFNPEIKKQIVNLSKGKIKSFNIDNNKVGYINVADKSVTSKPILKPFKFDIGKIESVTLNGDFPDKGYSYYNLDNNNVSYYNEIIPEKLFNKVSLDYGKNIFLSVYSPYKFFKLDDKVVYYLNENVCNGNIRNVSLDYNKFAYLKVDKESLDNQIIDAPSIVEKPKYKPISIDSNRMLMLDVPEKTFNIISLDDKKISYLNETSTQRYKKYDLDMNKATNIVLDVPKKKYNFSTIDPSKGINIKDNFVDNNSFIFNEDLFKAKNKPFDYETEKKVSDVSEKPSEYDKMFNSKPVLDSYAGAITPQTISSESIKPKLVDNLRIIDIQSTLDVVSKCHLMKGVNLREYEKMTIKNLEICNYELLAEILVIYKLVK